jgi:hypothetical protein
MSRVDRVIGPAVCERRAALPMKLQAISGYSPQQKFIDGLYEAYNHSSFAYSTLT